MTAIGPGFSRNKDYLLCVDSDGCAVDTMDIKHKRCFGPCMVEEWNLTEWEQPILERWNEINLYTVTRGINRFKGLAMALTEISAKYIAIDGIEELLKWTEQAPELSNPALEKEFERTQQPVFQKALRWSNAVNKSIGQLPWESKKAFQGVREAFEAAKPYADIVVVSSANKDAVEEEWAKFGLLPLIDLLLCQDVGSKAYCIGELKKYGYPEGHVLMTGDAPGDATAAEVNNVLYYPILVRREEQSWKQFTDEALPRFVEGSYTGEYQERCIQAFWNNLTP